MSSPDQNLIAALRDLSKGQVCIVGVGNRQRGDDAAGPRVIDGRAPGTRGVWFDAGTVPENFLEPIARMNPNNVLIVDAVAFSGFPGECRLLQAAALDAPALSTHAGSLATLSEYLAARTGARTWVLAIQPGRIDAHDGLSPPVERSVRALSAMLSGILACGSDSKSSTVYSNAN